MNLWIGGKESCWRKRYDVVVVTCKLKRIFCGRAVFGYHYSHSAFNPKEPNFLCIVEKDHFRG